MSIYQPPIKLRQFRQPIGERSIALISTLALVAIVSLMLVAFVTAMRQDRAATASYSQSLATDQLAKGGLQLVIGELRRELGKDVVPNTGVGNIYTNYPVYTSTTSAMPQPNGTNSAMPLLVKISTNNPSFTGTLTKGLLIASTINTTNASLNGRAVTTNRWNRPFLGQFPSGNNTPYWIYITRNGPTNTASISTPFGVTSTASPTLNNRAYNNNTYAVGRFAYAVYDQGGLLDITVAGHPTGLTAAQNNQIKGTLAGADLSVLGIDPDKLVKWRNQNSILDYITYVTGFGMTNGFRKVSSGDTTFLSRQDLIKAAINQTAGLSTNTLSSLTTFTREKNAPSWGPNGNLGGIYNYATLSVNNTATNRLTSLVRYTTSSTLTSYSYHSDGSTFSTTIKPGSPLLARRFPLDRLKWLTKSGPASGITDKTIQDCFGLKWTRTQASSPSGISGAYVWQYVGSVGTIQSSIKTLDQVAAETTPREPNFFELLQAGILTGSLGVDTLGSSRFPSDHQKSSLFQIFRIGACIIDQYDTDSYPTIIEYSEPGKGTTWQAVGVESLPYLNVWKELVGASPNSSSDSVAAYFSVGLWNPHRSAPLSDYPQVRIRVEGSVGMVNYWAITPSSPIMLAATSWTADSGYSLNGGVHTLELSETGIKGFLNPGILTSSALINPPSGSGSGTICDWALTPPLGGIAAGSLSPSAPPYVAYRILDLKLNPTDTTKTSIANATKTNSNSLFYQYGGVVSTVVSTSVTDPFQFMLEYKQPSGAWIPYNYFSGMNDSVTWEKGPNAHNDPTWANVLVPPNIPDATHSNALGAGGTTFATKDVWGNGATVSTQVSDPRSTRPTNFEFYRSDHGGTTTPGSYAGLQPLWTSTLTNTAYQPSGYGSSVLNVVTSGSRELTQAPGIFHTSATFYSYYPATLSHNTGDNVDTGYNGNSSYADNDKITRMADCGLFSLSAAPSGNPWQRPQDRPIVLNRPFQSVAELGYVLRDGPWKSLDLFTSNSADAGLLDLFCTNESSSTNVIAGRVNLNTQNPLVLQAILSGIITDTVSGALLSKPDAIAQSLVAYTKPTNVTAGPLLNKSDLATKFTPSLSGGSFIDNDEANIKVRRESIVRALSDVGQTRTWNLLIDLVAQTGKFPPTATALDQFLVEGERRYWLHIAIDRITGEIVDQQLETVIE